MTLTNAARAWYETGATPLPVTTDGQKRPRVDAWKHWQKTRPTPEQLAGLFNVDHDGIGIITGTISGNLTMLEAEGIAVTEGIITQLAQTFTDHGHENLWNTLMQGCSEITPTGGIHWYYRITDGPAHGNTKLARRPATEAELAQDPSNRFRVLLETRGEGGFSVTAPSAGRTHPTGKPWIQLTGSPTTIPAITSADQETIFDLCRLLDQMPEPTSKPAEKMPGNIPAPTPLETAHGDVKPGDDYNQRAAWQDILTPHGWTIDHHTAGTTYWVRPGKHARDGISATTGHSDDGMDRLYVFSTSTEFEPEIPYTKFGAYALLEHAGDHSAAARALREHGYGTPPQPQRHLTLLPSDTPATPTTTATTTSGGVDGANALAPIQHLTPATTIEATEDALATAFVARTSDQLRYCPQRSQWLTWTGSKWQWDEAEHHRELIRQLARRLPANDRTEAAWRRKMLSANGISSVARLARTDPRIVVHITDLDAQPWELNTPGGIINLRTGQLLPPDPAKLHTRSTTIIPNFDTPAPEWNKFLRDTFGNDETMIGFIQRLLGTAIVGEVLEQVLPFAHGAGANGKSTLIEAIMSALGRGENGYAIAAAAEMLMARKHNEHPAELAQLAGARLVVCSELEDGQRFAEARIKQLTGRDSINARHMYGNPFTFTPTHTIFLIANHKPMATVGGPAFWRRLILLPFAHVVPEHQRDPELPTKLEEEAPAILAWLAQGAAAWHQGGLRTPASVKAATEGYQRDEDTVARFIQEQCHVAAGGGGGLVQVKVAELRRAYEQACHELGDEPVSARRFTQELRDRWGIESSRTKDARFYKGITLIRAENNDDPDTLTTGDTSNNER